MRDAALRMLGIDVAGRAVRIAGLAHKGDQLAVLREISELLEDVDELKVIALQHARANKDSWEDIATATRVTVGTARRTFTEDYLTRRRSYHRDRALTRRSSRRTMPTRLASRPRRAAADHASTKNLPHRKPADTTPDTDTTPAPPAPDRGLASALSRLQRTSGTPSRRLAHLAGVSPSYICLILSGKRVPTWPITRTLATACHADPAHLRYLWELASGHLPQPPQIRTDTPTMVHDSAHRLRAAITGLTLTMHTDAPYALHADDGHDPTGLQAFLDGTTNNVAWRTVSEYTRTLRSEPAHLLPLWRHLQIAHNPYWKPKPPSTHRIPLAAFG
ncbi:helix-turn-helix domain-containing protein [Kitasatospora griseola]|uniref:helix-turn-helix domain-containing protein n=1 Tax=Kitasatospora griseola TaxID=2064 RepID=UPI0037F43248